MTGNRWGPGDVFNDVPDLYDQMRPGYPVELFDDFVAIAGIRRDSHVLEVGCGTGQATGSLASLGCSVTAVEPGIAMAAIARARLSDRSTVDVEVSTFEQWDDRGRTFDALVAAASWHWVEPSIGWPKAHKVVRADGWMALIGHVVVRRTGEPEVYAETADLHELFSPGNPSWGHPPFEDEVRTTDSGWGPEIDAGGLFGETVVRWYPTVQYFDGNGFADHLRTTSTYRRLETTVREPLLQAIAERIHTQMDDRAVRRYLCGIRLGQRAA
ncbi:MAG: methyltransferase domain-containing protein [Ilumatobacteraceae bacterium]